MSRLKVYSGFALAMLLFPLVFSSDADAGRRCRFRSCHQRGCYPSGGLQSACPEQECSGSRTAGRYGCPQCSKFYVCAYCKNNVWTQDATLGTVCLFYDYLYEYCSGSGRPPIHTSMDIRFGDRTELWPMIPEKQSDNTTYLLKIWEYGKNTDWPYPYGYFPYRFKDTECQKLDAASDKHKKKDCCVPVVRDDFGNWRHWAPMTDGPVTYFRLKRYVGGPSSEGSEQECKD